MGTHRISDDVERRLNEWMQANRKDTTYWARTLNECLDELLKEAGF
jgi:hypothetical protein